LNEKKLNIKDNENKHNIYYIKMIKAIIFFVALCIIQCICDTDIIKTINIKFIKSSSVGEYLKNLPLNMMTSFKHSLHTIEFEDEYVNLLMHNTLTEFDKNPNDITDDAIILKKNILNVLNNFIEKYKNYKPNKNILSLLELFLETCENVGEFCNIKHKKYYDKKIIDDIDNCKIKVSNILFEFSHEITYLVEEIKNEINKYLTNFNIAKMYYEPIFYENILIILENYVKLNHKIKEEPTYENLKSQLLILFENIINDFEKNINSKSSFVGKMTNDFEKSKLLYSLINLNKFINNKIKIKILN
jgi:hypothetical protein